MPLGLGLDAILNGELVHRGLAISWQQSMAVETAGGGAHARSTSLAGRGGDALRRATQLLPDRGGALVSPALEESSCEAFRALLGLRPGYCDEVGVGGRALYRPGEVSLPRIRAGGAQVVGPLPPRAHALLESGDGLMRSPEVRYCRLDAYWTRSATLAVWAPPSRRGALYGQLSAEMWEAGIIEAATFPAREVCGVFRPLAKLRSSGWSSTRAEAIVASTTLGSQSSPAWRRCRRWRLRAISA